MYTIKLDIGSWNSPSLGSGYVLSNPIKDGATILKQRDDNFRGVVRTKFRGNLLFYNISNGNDEYSILKNFLDSGEEIINAKIYYNGSERISGVLNLNTGEWDDNKKTARLTFQPEDEYSQIYKGLNTEYNIKSSTKESVKIQYQSKIAYRTTECWDGPFSDYVLNHDPDGRRTSGAPEDVALEWDYYNLESSVECEDGFIYTYSTNVLPFAYNDFEENKYLGREKGALFENGIYNYPPYNNYHSRTDLTTEIGNSIEFTEFFKLYDVIYDLLQLIDSSVNISESNYCTYFTVDDIRFNYLMLADKSDVKRYNATEKADFENITFEKLMLQIKQMFNLNWHLDSGVFKLFRPESLTLPSFSTYPKHDFTTINNGSSIVNNQQKFVFNSEKYFKEKWTLEESSYKDGFGNGIIDEMFSSENIQYSSLDATEKEYNLSDINNNIWYLKFDPEDANDTGFVFIATEEILGVRYIRYTFFEDAEYYQNPSKVNYLMSPESLINTHHKTDRPYSKGVIDGEETALTKRLDREYNFSNVPVWDINEINFSYLVKTDAGNLEPESFEVDLSLKNYSKFKGML